VLRRPVETTQEIGHAGGEPIRIIHVHLDVVYELIGLLDADLDLLADLGIDERGIPAVVGENLGTVALSSAMIFGGAWK